MKIRMAAALAGIGLMAFAVGTARANTLVNTITLPFSGGNGWTVSPTQSIALEFVSGSDSLVTGVDAYLGGSGSVQIGLMTASSGTFITGDVADVTLSNSSPIDLTSLAWSISPGHTYWLVAIGDPGANGGWNVSPSAQNSWTANGGLINTIEPPEAIVTGGSATPAPAALPLFAGGLGFVGYLTRRRKQSSKQALAAA